MNKRTPAQIEASRRNGAQSKGPITEDGKARASANSLKHGLNSHRLVIMHNESPEEFQRLHERIFEEFEPTHPTAITLAEDLVLSTWRLTRIIALETAAMDYETETQRDTLGAAVSGYDQATQTHLAVAALIDRSRVLTWYSRHEGRLRRAIRDARAQLEAFRTPPAAPVPPEPAPSLMAPEHHGKTSPLNPTAPIAATHPEPAPSGTHPNARPPIDKDSAVERSTVRDRRIAVNTIEPGARTVDRRYPRTLHIVGSTASSSEKCKFKPKPAVLPDEPRHPQLPQPLYPGT